MGTFIFGGLPVAYLDAGAGERAVVFVHGFPFRASMWDGQVALAVASGFRAVAPDLPGFGDSAVPEPPGGYSIDRYADLVAALIGELGLGPVVLAGLSMGGYVSLAVARRHPEVLAALVLADTRAEPDSPQARQARTDHQALIAEGNDVAPLVEGTLNRVLSGSGPRQAEARAFLELVVAATAPAAWIGALEAMKNRRDQRDLLAAIAVPTLVVVGERDALVPFEVAQGLAKAIPNAHLEVVAGAGHVSNLENPEAFNRVLAEFLATLPTPS